MAYVYFKNAAGEDVYVSAENPLPVSGAGGGGMEPTDITATAPATATDNGDGTVTVGVTTGTTAGTVATGNHTHTADDIESGTLAIARVPTGTTGSTVALGNHTHAGLVAQQPAIADLTAAPTMEDFNGLLAALRAAGVIAS